MLELQSELESIQKKGLWRTTQPAIGIDFASNDYLGFSRSSKIRSELIKFLNSQPSLGSTGSRLISGDSSLHQDLESFIATTFRSESALLFGSGYLANLGLMTALGSLKGAEFFSDEYNHASLIDGMRLTKSKIHIFNHNNLNHLEELLLQNNANIKIIVTESVFSMKGDSPDFTQLLALAEKFHAFLVFDEAHATGVCGKNGLGLISNITSSTHQIASIHTGGKALGAYGAFIVCNNNLRDLMINKSRSFIYSTALPPIILHQLYLALIEIQNQNQKIQLEKNIIQLKEFFKEFKLVWNHSHIGFVSIPTNEKAIAASEYLLNRGLHVRAIRSPTVPPGHEGLRITLKSFHNETELRLLAESLSQVNT